MLKGEYFCGDAKELFNPFTFDDLLDKLDSDEKDRKIQKINLQDGTVLEAIFYRPIDSWKHGLKEVFSVIICNKEVLLRSGILVLVPCFLFSKQKLRYLSALNRGVLVNLKTDNQGLNTPGLIYYG